MPSLGRLNGGAPVVSSYPNVLVVYPVFGRYVVYLISPDDPTVMSPSLDPVFSESTPLERSPYRGFPTNFDFAGALASSINFPASLAAEHFSG